MQTSKEQDRIHKINAIKNNNASQAIGESFMVHHLKALKVLVKDGDDWYTK
jgi:hypothetical protein